MSDEQEFFQGIPVVCDPDCPADTIFLMNHEDVPVDDQPDDDDEWALIVLRPILRMTAMADAAPMARACILAALEGDGLPELLSEVERLRGVVEAADYCVETAAELRRHIHPDEGCGYETYRQVWDASFAAEAVFKIALAALDEAR